MLSTNLLIENNIKEILISKLDRFLEDIKNSCSKLIIKVNKKELKYINKEKNAR